MVFEERRGYDDYSEELSCNSCITNIKNRKSYQGVKLMNLGENEPLSLLQSN